MPNLFTGDTIGTVYDGTAHNANLNLLEASLFDLGPFVISGLSLGIGAGLAATVTAGTASIGGQVVAGAGFSIAGLTPSSTNHLFLLQNGTGTANTSGTPPANSVKLGTAATNGTNVTSVDMTHPSGRQAKVRSENLVMGGGAGHPRSVNLNSWNATAADGFEVYGVLPSAALPPGGSTPSITTKNVDYALTYTDFYILADASGGARTMTLPTAVGHAGKEFEVKKIDVTANAVHVQTTGGQTIDTVAPPYNLVSSMAALRMVSDGANWWIS